MNKYLIEVCANSTESCIKAQEGGAQRVELCAGIPEGGTTPSYGEISIARKRIDIALNVIIRPRGGDFLYSEDEVEIMKRDIRMARELGSDGVVFGCLTREGKVDKGLCKELIFAAGHLSLTFHRAFDVCSDPFEALEDIIELGFDRILTSGCEANAIEGRDLLKELVEKAAGRIIIMPGCGVNENNIKELQKHTGAVEFHMSARSKVNSEMVFRNDRVSMGGTVVVEEFSRDVTSAERVADSLKELN
ncbi:MAG: copper homeostasis protein CutC [Rikenellaceae bacterium]